MNIQECPAILNWTIESKLRDWKVAREGWAEDFEANYKQVADKISESITKVISELLEKRLSDPYKPIPKSANTLKFNFRLDIGDNKNCKHIKEWAQDSANLPPFKEWFEKWEDNPEASLEPAFFQDQFSRIGHVVQENVMKNLSSFAGKPQNSYLSHSVEWYRKSEKYFSDPTFQEDNCLLVDLWIDMNVKYQNLQVDKKDA